MSSITFQCNACEGDFELEIARLIEKPGLLRCGHCGVKASNHRAETLATSLEDLITVMAALRAKFRFDVDLETDELPPPYGPIEPSEASRLNPLSSSDDDEDDEDDDDEESFLDGDDDDFLDDGDDEDDGFGDDDLDEDEY